MESKRKIGREKDVLSRGQEEKSSLLKNMEEPIFKKPNVLVIEMACTNMGLTMGGKKGKEGSGGVLGGVEILPGVSEGVLNKVGVCGEGVRSL